MTMFEILQGDIFDRCGRKLVVFKVRVEVTGGVVQTLIHYLEGNDIRIRPAEAFCRLIAEGIEGGEVSNLNRPADFASG